MMDAGFMMDAGSDAGPMGVDAGPMSMDAGPMGVDAGPMFCSPNPCMNGGSCAEEAAGFVCACPDGFTGTRCEIRNACLDEPCRNGGTCTQVGSGYSCECPAGFLGDDCELVDTCADSPCLNGGACSVSGDTFVCACPAGYRGETCNSFRDNFSSSLDSAWRQVDNGTVEGPQVWTVSGGNLVSTGNSFDAASGSAVPFFGAFVWRPGTWTNGLVRVRVSTTDNDGIGVMGRVRDANNYYRFHVDEQQGMGYLYKRSGGVSTLLGSAPTGYPDDFYFRIELEFVGNLIRANINGTTIIQVVDTSISRGGIGLYTRGVSEASFDNIEFLPSTLANTFTSGAQASWETFDNGTSAGPSSWRVRGGGLESSGNSFDPASETVVPFFGTFLVMPLAVTNNGIITTTINSTDNDGVGLMGRVLDENNYYRCHIDEQQGMAYLYKRVAGVSTLLASAPAGYTPGTEFNMRLFMNGTTLQCIVDRQFLNAEDASLSSGGVGLYARGNSEVSFRSVSAVEIQ